MAQRSSLFPLAFVAALGWAAAAAAQTAGAAAPNQHYDLNVYPALPGSGGEYDLNVAGTQNGPPGTIAMTSASPPPAYSFKDVLANTHGFLEAGLSSRGGHEFNAGVSIPLLPGKADLDLAAGTGQVAAWPKTVGGKTPLVTYDTYSAGLHLHPTDDTDAYIGFTGLRLHGPTAYPYGFGYP
jgi:hypothetical protein